MKTTTYSARSILQSLGTGEVQATAAIFAMQLFPASSDPDAASTIVIVNAMQRGMVKLGCPLQINGRIDKATANCLHELGGPHWENKTWLTLGEQLLLRQAAGDRFAPKQNYHQSVGAIGMGSQLGGLLLIGGVAYLAFKLKK
jgi:hypothetical protein